MMKKGVNMRMRVLMVLAAAIAVMWATDANQMQSKPGRAVTSVTESSVPAALNAVTTPGASDAPAGYRPTPAAPTAGPGPQAGSYVDQGGPGNPAKPLWGTDQLVYGGPIESPPYYQSRMISQDAARDGDLYAAYVESPGDTAIVVRSTDGGATWNRISYVFHTGYVLSSLKLVVAEGDSNFLYLFFLTSAGNGDFYMYRTDLDGSTGHVIVVKSDADTLTNCSGIVDKDSNYYVYTCFEQHGGGLGTYSAHTRISRDYGFTWVDDSGDADDTRVPPTPDISYGWGSRLYMTYMDKRLSSQVDTANIRVKISPDYGTSWRQSTQVGQTRVPVSNPVIGASNAPFQSIWLVHVRDLTLFNGSGLAVCYYVSHDTGATWQYGGDGGIGHGNTPNNEEMPSIAIDKIWGSATVSYSVIPSDSLMFTWCSYNNDTAWTQVDKINDHRHTGNFPSSAGWTYYGGGDNSSILYGGVGPDSVWFDYFSNSTGISEKPGPVAVSSAPQVLVFPDPVRSAAKVSFSLPKPGKVELAVYTVSGSRAATLLQGSFPAGRHEARFDAASLAAGVYVARLTVNGTTETSRIVVLH
jgi:hypothetical protein